MTAACDAVPERAPGRTAADVQAWIRAWAPRLLLLCAVGLIVWLIPGWLRLPVPDQAIDLNQARFEIAGMAPRTVRLPHDWPDEVGPGPAVATYSLDLPAFDPDEPMVLLLPSTRMELTARLNGELLQRDAPQLPDTQSGSSAIFRLPVGATGGDLDLTLERPAGALSGHLSVVHLVKEKDLAPMRWLWVMGDGVIRMIALSIHVLIVFAIAIVWSARRQDGIFCWLFLLSASSLFKVVSITSLVPSWLAWTHDFMPLTYATLGLAVIGLALAVIDVKRPLWLKYGVVLLPLILALASAAHILPVPLARLIAFTVGLGGSLVGGVLLLGLGRRPTAWDQLLLAAPFLLIGCFGLMDVGVVLGIVDQPFLLTSYVRTMVIVAILALLMRRLAASLGELDVANETQHKKLLTQEAELTLLHAEAQDRITQATREEERRRLMSDLHDGVSGHLVSIIALSERERTDRKDIETAARAALEDLRLVIDSLDLEDSDLRLAISGFRERLAPQLRRMGVTFAWSMENLPEVRGVTPANALSILRILQEAVTNALKHGPATRIAVNGTVGPDGAAVLTVTNDLRTATPPSVQGRGLNNMRRRAHRLGGEVGLERKHRQAVLTLSLPRTLAN